MTSAQSDHMYLENVSPDHLAALIFELASQLQVERQRRVALETILQRAGLLEAGTIDGLVDDPEVKRLGRAGLDISMRRLLRIVTETGGPTVPLRAERAE